MNPGLRVLTGPCAPGTVRDLIDVMARRQDRSVFLIDPESHQTLTFGDFGQRARHVASVLLQKGVLPGHKVAFLLDNGLTAIQVVLGAMYGGFVPVPINVRAGALQISYTINHCDADVILVKEAYRPLLDEALGGVRRPVHVLRADEDVVSAPAQPERALTCPDPADPALLIYTSGSTGQPKGVVHSHRTLMAGAANTVQAHELTSSDRSLLVLPLYHSNAEAVTLLPTLLSGGSVVVPRRFNVHTFWSSILDHRCTWSALVPTIVSQILDWHDDGVDPDLSNIRFFRSSSAPLSAATQRAFIDKFHVPLLQAMGATEVGNTFTNPLPPRPNKLGSPGLPSGFDVTIADPQGRALPANQPGEVLVRGAAVMCGYYKDPGATADVLDADGWWHTGDLAYRDEDGYLFVVGRSKELIIKGGMNIAPRQIDEVLESHAAVREAAAVGIPDRIFGETIVAFVVLRTGASSSEAELLAFCKSRLGLFKTPSRIYFVEDLPKGPSGKVQRLALPALMAASDSALASSGESAAASASRLSLAASTFDLSSIRSVIAAAWEAVLGGVAVEPDRNFFEVGGHSLLAIDCLFRLRDRLPVALSLSDFFEHATIAQQADLVWDRLTVGEHARPEHAEQADSLQFPQGGDATPALDLTSIRPRGRGESTVLSPGQQRLWFLEQLHPGLPAYNAAEAVRLLGPLNVDALASALNAIIDRHELLRATIGGPDGESSLVVHPRWPIALEQIDLSSLASHAAAAEVERLLVEEPRRPYDLTARPGIRATLVRLSEREHVFILMMHHLVCDWSSLGVIWRELSAFYAAHQRGESLTLPPLPIQYGDYSAWQQAQVAQHQHADDLAYWRERLRGAPEILDLPTDRPRPRQASYAGAVLRAPLPPAAGHAARQIGRRERTSPFVVFATALNALLCRYSGQPDVSMGIPIADRDRPELQPLIGFLLQTQVLRTQVSTAQTFRELLAGVQKGVLELYAHRAVPFDQVVAAAGLARTLSHSQLFQVMLTWRDRDQQPSFIGLSGCVVEPLLADSRTSKFDLTFFITDNGDDEFWIDIEYSVDLFDPDRIGRMIDHLAQLLESAAAAPEAAIGTLQMLTEVERQQILIEWNQTDAAYPTGQTVHQLFEGQAARIPSASAIVFAHERMSFEDLNAKANRVARALQAFGVGCGSLVGVCLDRTPDLVVGLLAILKAGGAYVPLDPAYPKDRTSFIVGDAGVATLLTTRRLKSCVAGSAARILCFEELETADLSTADLNGPTLPNDLAYVLFTSGSTGRPKGVSIRHLSVVALASWASAQFSDAERAGVLASTSICFDLSVFELLVTLATGGTVILANNALALHELPARNEVTLVNTVPSAMDELIRLRDLPPSVVTVNLAGEPLDPSLVDRVYQHSSVSRVYDLYGPSETTTYSTCALRPLGGRATIGRPIANTRVYVLDGCGQPVPVGVPGQLYIGGLGLARDYWHRPELTADRFVVDPTGVDRGVRLYRTGDVVRYFPDGSLEFLGRQDDQVKLRGYRIELGEIETVLRAHAAVREAVVLVTEDRGGNRGLSAYLTTTALDDAEDILRAHLRSRLPDYMIPSVFVVVDSLPILPNGKIDRTALRALQSSTRGAHEGHTPPVTDTEKALCGIWSRVLGVESVGIHDGFFALGGHSLLVIQVVVRIREVLGVEVPLPQVFDASTVAEQADVIDTLRWMRSRREEPGRIAGGAAGPPPTHVELL